MCLAMEQAIARFMAHQQVALAQLENHPPVQFRSSRLLQLARGRARVDRHPGWARSAGNELTSWGEGIGEIRTTFIDGPTYTGRRTARSTDMGLRRSTSVTIGVPNHADTIADHTEFGLPGRGEGRFSTVAGGQQLQLVQAPSRRPMELGTGVDDRDDLDRIAGQLSCLDLPAKFDTDTLLTEEPIAGFRGHIKSAPAWNSPSSRQRHTTSPAASTGPTAVHRASCGKAPCSWSSSDTS
jgi:hypothetical protein